MGELQESLFHCFKIKQTPTQEKDNLQRSIVNGIIHVTMNVQRLESENILSIISPRAPAIKYLDIINKTIQNTGDGYHFNSTYWQTYKQTLPKLPQDSFEIAVGMILGDATMYYISHHALIKFEQGAKQKDFLFHLFQVFSPYCFMTKPFVLFCLKIEYF